MQKVLPTMVMKHQSQLVQLLRCPICMGISSEPTQCARCQSYFCSDCVELWITQNNKCPNLCEGQFQKANSKHRLFKSLLSLITVDCNYCEESMSYRDFLKHLQEQCIQAQTVDFTQLYFQSQPEQFDRFFQYVEVTLNDKLLNKKEQYFLASFNGFTYTFTVQDGQIEQTNIKTGVARTIRKIHKKMIIPKKRYALANEAGKKVYSFGPLQSNYIAKNKNNEKLKVMINLSTVVLTRGKLGSLHLVQA